MNVPPAFLDANVLYSRTICDWLFLLADEARGRLPPLVSSEDCLAEALYRFRRNNPTVDGDRIARKRAMLTAALDDVIESYSGSTPFPGSDEHDTHVHAAVLACNAGYLVTDDAGFGRIEPDLLPYEVHTSDSFLLLIEENHPQMVDRVIIRMVGYRNDRGERSNLVESLTATACPDSRPSLQHIYDTRPSTPVASDSAKRTTPKSRPVPHRFDRDPVRSGPKHQQKTPGRGPHPTRAPAFTPRATAAR